MAWKYAAIVKAKLVYTSYKMSANLGWVLVSNYGDTEHHPQHLPELEIRVKSTELTKLEKYGASKKDFNDITKGEWRENCRLAAIQAMSELDTLHCIANSALNLVNVAAEDGWETTGQIPGFPGPTSITMMRKKLD